MTTLQDRIDKKAAYLTEIKLECIKFLKEFKILTPKEYTKCLKRIHSRKQKDNADGLIECPKTFLYLGELNIKPGIYKEGIKIKNGVSLIGDPTCKS